MPQIVNLWGCLRGDDAALCLSPVMENSPFQQALSHLEEAVARLEKVARASAPDDRLAALEERHRRLRDGATAALERLDRLIGQSPPPPGDA